MKSSSAYAGGGGAMKVKTLTNDPLGRWVQGEIGDTLENDYDKYDYFVQLKSRTIIHKDSSPVKVTRCLYFYANEVEVSDEQ